MLFPWPVEHLMWWRYVFLPFFSNCFSELSFVYLTLNPSSMSLYHEVSCDSGILNPSRSQVDFKSLIKCTTLCYIIIDGSNDHRATSALYFSSSHSSSKQVLFLGWFSSKNLLEKDASGEWNARLVVAPLFETIPDLEVLPEPLYLNNEFFGRLASLFLIHWFIIVPL